MPARPPLWNYGKGSAGAVPERLLKEEATVRVERPKPLIAEAGKGKMRANAKKATGSHRMKG